jgi:hypothetical protein
MKYNIQDAYVVVRTDNHKATLLKSKFSEEILDSDVLKEMSLNDLLIIWKNLFGIPGNVKDILARKIELYSSSSNINSFIYEGKEYWLDKDNRNSLWNLSNSSLGNLEIVIGDEVVTLSSLKLKAFLLKLEVYAYKCFVNTFKHLKAAKKLSEIEDIINYDYTTGYPDKVTLE